MSQKQHSEVHVPSTELEMGMQTEHQHLILCMRGYNGMYSRGDGVMKYQRDDEVDKLTIK